MDRFKTAFTDELLKTARQKEEGGLPVPGRGLWLKKLIAYLRGRGRKMFNR